MLKRRRTAALQLHPFATLGEMGEDDFFARRFTGADGVQYFDKTSSNFCAPAGGFTLPAKISAGKTDFP